MELTNEQISAAQAQINNQIQDIDFEDSPTHSSPSSEEIIPATSIEKPYELVYVQNSIGTALNISRDIIEGLKTEYNGLTITGIQDKDGIKTVGNALKRVKDIYRNIDKKREELKAPVLKAGRDIDNEAKELSALLKAVIDPLEAEDNRIKKLIEEDKTKVQREQEKVMNERLVVLKEMGAVQQGVFYCVGQSVSITPDVLKTMDVLEWDKLLKKVEEANKEEEKKREKEEEEKADLIKARKELDEIKQKIADTRASMRQGMIKMLGYVEKERIPGMYDLTSSDFPDVTVNLTDDHISQYDDAAFMKYLTENKERFDRVVTSRTILKQKNDRLVIRGNILSEMGMTFNHHVRGWRYKEDTGTCYQDIIADLADSEFKDVVSAMKKSIELYDKKIADADLEQKENERLEKIQQEANRNLYLPTLILLKLQLEEFEKVNGNLYQIFPDHIRQQLDDLSDYLQEEINPSKEDGEDFGDEAKF